MLNSGDWAFFFNLNENLVSKETVMPRPWGSETPRF